MASIVPISDPATRRSALLGLGSAALIAATTQLSWFVSGPTICPFAVFTGHACPLCGGTRAFSALIRGDIGEAWAMHPIIFVVLPLLGWAGVVWASGGRVSQPANRTVNRVLGMVGVLAMLIWVFRGLAGTLPPI